MTADFSRYSCQMALPGFSETAQTLLQQAKVLVVGAGGLGCPAAQYLASSGIGTLGIADDDTVSITNLHRQILYTPTDVGRQKATVACHRLQKQNPGIKVVPHLVRITSQNVLQTLALYDIVVDGTDNFETRYLLNDAAVLLKKPLVYGAIYQFEGQVSVWNVQNEDNSYSPNYRDLYPDVDATQVPNCTEGGVISTLAGIIGCMQANEVIKYITQTGDLLTGKLLIFDALTLQSRVIKISKSTKVVVTALTETTTGYVISPEKLKQGLAEQNYELVDVRTEQERNAHNIGGEHIPLQKLEQHLDYFKTGSTKILYCATGKRSAQAVKLIKKKLPQAKIFSLEGGLAQFDMI